MRSISSHWKRDFVEQEAALESEIMTRSEKGDWISPMEYVMSNDSSLDSDLIAREVMDKLSRQYPSDSAAGRVVVGWKKDLTASAIMQSSNLTKSEYQGALKQIRQCLLGWGYCPRFRARRDPRGRRYR
jgi:hypothetical protein